MPESPQTCNFIKKETLAQVFSYEICEIIKNTFFAKHLQATASVGILGITRPGYSLNTEIKSF